MKVLNVILFYFIAIHCINGHAQPCTPNADCKKLHTSEEIEGNAVIVASEIPYTTSTPDIPVISRLDKNGNIVWELQGDLDGYYFLHKIRLYDLTEDYIYVLLTIPENYANDEPFSQIWKVDKSTGVIEWESQLFESDYESKWRSIGMFDYNDSLICFYNPIRDNNGGTIDGFELYTIDKVSNTMELVHENNQQMTSISMLCDHQGNIITASHNVFNWANTNADIEKFNGLNLNQRIWHTEFLQSTSADIDEVKEFIIDNKGYLFLITGIDGWSADSLTLTKFNGMTGDLLWNTKLSSSYNWQGRYKIFQNELYAMDLNWHGTMIKVDLDNGAVLWSNSNMQYNVPGLTSSCHFTVSGLHAIDFDCNGYAYITGFDKSLPGAWGIMKVDISYGNMIASNVITLDTTYVDIVSVGERIHVLDDSLVIIGYLQTDSLNRVLTTVSGDELISAFDFPWFYVDQQASCDSIVWIDGNTYSASNNTATFSYAGTSGCDSIVLLDLTINSSAGIDSITTCNPITWIDGNVYSTNNNTATHVLTNVAGCDSTVTLNLTFDNYAVTDARTECAPYTWIDGVTYTASNNTATQMLTSTDGCDSLVTLNLTIQQVNTNLFVNDPTITANLGSGTYQWLDCDNAYNPISGETSQSFTATSNGNYAVIITANGCSDTSNCVNIATAGIDDENSNQASFTIFPNPTKGIVNLEFSDYLDFSTVKIYNLLGQTISEILVNKNQMSLELGESSGVYYIGIIKLDGDNQMIKVIKQ